MQRNDTNTFVVNDKLKAFIGKLGGLWVRKLEGGSLDKFSRSMDFVEEKSVEANDTGNDQCTIKDLNMESRFFKYFREAVNNKHKWLTDPLYFDLPRNYDFSLF